MTFIFYHAILRYVNEIFLSFRMLVVKVSRYCTRENMAVVRVESVSSKYRS